MSINRINCRHKKNFDYKTNRVTRYNCAQLVSSLLNKHVITCSINDHYLFLLTFQVKNHDRLLFSCFSKTTLEKSFHAEITVFRLF